MSKLKICKMCGEEISNSVKICPHCGSKLKRRKLRYIIFAIIALIIIVMLIPTGKDNGKNTLETSKSPSSNSSNETKDNIKSGIDLLSYIGKSKDDIKKSFGTPSKIDGAQSGELYDYKTFYFTIDKNKVSSIEIKSSGQNANGIPVGTSVKDVKNKLGNPTKELNNNGFIMEYRLNDNTTSIEYICNDFHSPVNSIVITDLTAGKEKPMEVTKEKVESLIEGNWVLEQSMNEPNISAFINKFSDGVKDEGNGAFRTKYSISNSNTIIYHVWNKTDQEYHDLQYFIEFYEDGQRMEIYTLDNYGDRDPNHNNIYYRYN
ncbi:zinc-ribbon domain-containing protein [Clostridium manihotivorum]|uniref:Zinc-ribbon domain-containing protein n=1 Tax=Clostridium manihotivorum TaxID=2320868 RepID=A0A3R5V505_9CLOT|nr:DUF4309 domain-containing protein [Clostridium manihotivorum]QAA30359.1 hypothetical protein C1I91_00925 [Clostridium manihotivorum]